MVSVPSERKPGRHPRRAFEHILTSIEDIRRFTAGLDEKAFKANDLVVAAVERCLGRLTEAALRLGSTAEATAPDIPWDRIRGLGNILRHNYDTVSLDTLWQIVTGNLNAPTGDIKGLLRVVEISAQLFRDYPVYGQCQIRDPPDSCTHAVQDRRRVLPHLPGVLIDHDVDHLVFVVGADLEVGFLELQAAHGLQTVMAGRQFIGDDLERACKDALAKLPSDPPSKRAR